MSSGSDDPASSLHLDFAVVESAQPRRNAWSARTRLVAAVGLLAVAVVTIAVAVRSGGDSNQSADDTEIVPLPTTPPTVETLPENLD
ncbi:MAG: hypothetical protein ACI9N0_001546, partial [Ilumatobacter sp.]